MQQVAPGFQKFIRETRRKLPLGFFPVYKKKGQHYTDLMDTMRITLEFETGLQFKKCEFKIKHYPAAHREQEGILSKKMCFIYCVSLFRF